MKLGLKLLLSALLLTSAATFTLYSDVYAAKKKSSKKRGAPASDAGAATTSATAAVAAVAYASADDLKATTADLATLKTTVADLTAKLEALEGKMSSLKGDISAANEHSKNLAEQTAKATADMKAKTPCTGTMTTKGGLLCKSSSKSFTMAKGTQANCNVKALSIKDWDILCPKECSLEGKSYKYNSLMSCS
jgi:uncharacterized phage infection (PIP) family protein YhgE